MYNSMKAQLKALPSFFDKPVSSPDILIIAGEHSGDEHAASLINSIFEKNPHYSIYALGGQKLKHAGAHLLWDLTESSVVGFVEVLKNYSYFKQLFQLIFDWIKEYKPKLVCFVDYPGFNLRLAESLYINKIACKAGGSVKLAYYIGPQIWAWKAGRRFKMAKILDGLGVIFPFELECYKDTDLPVTFVGHPFVQKDFRLKVHYNPHAPILLLPGSRQIAVRYILPILLRAFSLYLKIKKDQKAIIIVPSKAIETIVLNILDRWPNLKPYIMLRDHHQDVFGCATLVSSGTMSLSCVLAEIPCAIVYKANWFTYILGRLLVKIKYLGIVNILLDRLVCQEYLQNIAKPDVLSQVLLGLPYKYLQAQSIAKEVRAKLSNNQGIDAALWLNSFLLDESK